MSTAPHDNVRGRWLFGPARTRGLAAIELASVIAVTFVMIALGTSALRTYSARSAISNSLLAVAPVQALVAHAFERAGAPPVSNDDVPGLVDAIAAHGVVETIVVEHGRVEIRYGDDASTGIRGRGVLLTPFETTDGRVVWLCGYRSAEVGLYPLGFAGGTNRPTSLATTIEPRYLPAECR
jgi:ribosome modulation factor